MPRLRIMAGARPHAERRAEVRGVLPMPFAPATETGLDALFRPRSIAIIGASENPATISGRPLHVLRQHDFAGPLYLVNPNRAEIAGQPCHPDIAAVPEPVDLALVAVRAALVPGIIADAAAAGTRAAVIFSSGFGEQDAAGQAAQARLSQIARDTGIRLLGPNGEGFFNVAAGVPASFSPTVDRSRGLAGGLVTGGLAVVSQSGGLGFALFNGAQAAGLGASFVVTTGNECDVDALEAAAFCLEDPATTVIALLVEGFAGGPAALAPVARRARELGKHLVLAKLGRSPAGRRSAPTHSAHDAGDPAAYDRAADEAGVVRAEDQEDLLDACLALSRARALAGRRVGIVTASGGAGIWAADACEGQGLTVPVLSAATQGRLRGLMPPYGVAANPVDLTAQGISGGNVVPALEILAASGEVDAVLVVVTLAGPDLLRREGAELDAAATALGLPVLIYGYTAPGSASREILSGLALPWYTSPRRAARALRALVPGAGTPPAL
jgi:acyl-CoA synthetase (NDP forming)